MRFKRHMFLTLILLLTIFSLSFASASEIGTYEQNTGELNSISISDIDPIDANLNNVNDIDEIETDDCLTNNGTQLLRSSNDEKDEDLEMLRAGNDLEILGASNDVDILTAYDGPTPENPIAQIHFSTDYWYGGTFYGDRTVSNIFAQIQYRLPNGGVIYLDGATYTGSQRQTGGRLENIWIIGGSSFTDTARATFRQPANYEGSLVFYGTEIVNCRFTGLSQTDNRFFTVDQTYNNGVFRGYVSNTIFDYCDSYGQFFFCRGHQGNMQGVYNVDDATANGNPYSVTNVSFINCDHTYGADPLAYEDGHGQFVAALGMAMEDCVFINCTSGQHSSAICINDESGWGPGYIASSIKNTQFINLTAKWFAVYIHGRYDGETGGGAPNHDHMIGYEVVENCTFINCEGTENYGGGLGISHDNVLVKNCTFINNTGGQGAAIMVGGIASDENTVGRYAFRGDNTKGNNITIQDCIFEDCSSTVHDYRWNEGTQQWYYGTSNGIGGAVFIVGNNTKVLNCIFNNNTGTNGSAMYIYGINTTVVGTNFTNNNASEDGAVFIYGANTNVTDSKFNDNTAVNGAGVYIIGENAYIGNTEFNNNTADPDSGLGGAIDVIGDHCILLTVTCNNNTASRGGAGFIRGNNTKVSNSTFNNNNATIRGGGLDVYGNNFNATDLDVSNNNAKAEGG
ncbi:MAG: hypothetical protein IJI93_09115, partial [Methanobrevibacter sp.]|nr:hypothetical protein [Methanobrevibacter sp.]